MQADVSIELDFRRLIPLELQLLVTRLPSVTEVASETLASMEGHLTAMAALFPASARFAAVGRGCTSGTAQIGAAEVARRVHAGTVTQALTEPVSALTAACRLLGLTRLALPSPYAAPVSERLRQTLGAAGIETQAFGSFDVAEEARVARIDGPSIMRAAEAAAGHQDVSIFLSCTNLRSPEVIPAIEPRLGVPVLSSNLVLACHLLRLAGSSAAAAPASQLLAPPAPRFIG